ncbi:fasciclin domain-containing protein [Pseudanabaena sp. FACHB-2040]|uniref:fasciclin domain-containing protein n=1 Tax=Pseudanabaena sp. FACHB-2040 TaxID=2692859 RepID=UPI0018EF8623|nr:fasciclin domain-containing protein [Pseudanabaena sp. FACHB-2040]
MEQMEMQPTEMNQPGAATTNNIVDIAANGESFSTLEQAVQSAGLVNTLSGEGPYTVFAPTDEAFSLLPDGAIEYLFQPENQDLLRQVLTYHVVRGEVTASEIATGPVEAIGGGLAVRVADDGRVIVNNASVVNADIQASNGVIHAVNRVLLPETLQQTLASRLGLQDIYQ